MVTKWTRTPTESYPGRMSLLIRGARVLTPAGVAPRADVLISGGRVRAVGARLAVPPGVEVLPVRGALLAPGLIDLQINGAFGVNFSMASPAEVTRAAGRLAAVGVTGFLPTLISLPRARTVAALGRLAEAARSRSGARLLGVHLEGPFLNPRRRGAHRAVNIRPPSVAEFRVLWRASRGLLRLMTLAPELPGAMAVIREARRCGVAVSAGHTEAGAAALGRAARAGAGLVTHLFNAMPPFHHREDGPAAAALLEDRLSCSLVYDRNHVSPEAAALALRAKGRAGLILVSDGVFALGLPPGGYRADGTEYELAGGAFRVRRGPLGGSVSPLSACVRMFASDVGVALADAWRLGSENPARLLGRRLGVVAPGRPADLVLVSPRGAVQASFVGGVRWK